RTGLPQRLTRLLFSACMACLAMPALGPSAALGEEAGKSWAVLIGVERYQRATPLRYTINDVVQIGRTLATRGDYDATVRVLQITDDASDPLYRPTKKAIMDVLPGWLKRPAPQDQILLYFSGH